MKLQTQFLKFPCSLHGFVLKICQCDDRVSQFSLSIDEEVGWHRACLTPTAKRDTGAAGVLEQIALARDFSEVHAIFVLGDTDYIVNSTFQPSPGGPGVYALLEKHKELYRGAVTFHKFDRKAGRIKLEDSFQMELPPVEAVRAFVWKTSINAKK